MELSTALLIMGSVIAAGTIYLLGLRFVRGMAGRVWRNLVILPAQSATVPEVHVKESVTESLLPETPQTPELKCIPTVPAIVDVSPLFLIGTALIALGLGLKLRSLGSLPASRRPSTPLAAGQ